MKVSAIKCNGCGDTIYSRAPHDFRRCACQSIYVDGGLSRFRCGGAIDQMSRPFDLIVSASVRELYDDWNKSTDRFGLISGKL